MKKNWIAFSWGFLSLLIFAVIFSPALYAGTNISFSNNISGEFPDATSYNRFVSNLNDAFSNGMKYRMHSQYNLFITNSQMQIVNQVKKFNFSFNSVIPTKEMSYSFTNTSKDTLVSSIFNDIDRNFECSDNNYSGNLNFGFKLKDELSLYVTIGAVGGLIYFGFNALWGIWEKTIIKPNNRKLNQRLSFSPAIVFAFFGKWRDEGKTIFHSDTFPYGDANGNSSYFFDGNNGKISITRPVEVYKFRRHITSIDLSIKYFLKYHFFNLNLILGATFHINHVEEHFKMLSTNIDYTGGSPTGVDTQLEVNSSSTWLNIMPHFTIGLQYFLADWITLRAPFFSIVYLPVEKMFRCNLYFGIEFLF